LFAHYVRRFKQGRRRWAEVRWRARAIAARHQQSISAQTASPLAASKSDVDALWE
jgi:hypothetical protein